MDENILMLRKEDSAKGKIFVIDCASSFLALSLLQVQLSEHFLGS